MALERRDVVRAVHCGRGGGGGGGGGNQTASWAAPLRARTVKIVEAERDCDAHENATDGPADEVQLGARGKEVVEHETCVGLQT